MTTTYTPQFSINDTAFYVIYSIMKIYQVMIYDVIIENGYIYYTLYRADIDRYIARIPEGQVYTFDNAKASLITYLQNKLVYAQNLTEKTV